MVNKDTRTEAPRSQRAGLDRTRPRQRQSRDKRWRQTRELRQETAETDPVGTEEIESIETIERQPWSTCPLVSAGCRHTLTCTLTELMIRIPPSSDCQTCENLNHPR